MTPAQADLARRIVALPGWEWQAGMRVIEPEYGWTALRLTGRDETYWHGIAEDDEAPSGTTWYRVRHEHMALRTPDLADPTGATAGALLGMLWRADPAAGWHVHGPPGLICVHNGDRSREFYGDTLGEAVAAALIAVGRCA